MDKEKGNEKTPQHILVDGIEHPASHGKVKGNFGKDGKDQKSGYIFFEIFCNKKERSVKLPDVVILL